MDKYILVSLNDKKSKDLAHSISNKTARKILDYLSENDKASPSNLSEKLNIPLSTITYSIKQLKKQGLIEKKDAKWSEKGKKIFFYSLAKKMIIIVPKNVDWKESLKKILPVAFIGFFASIITKLVTKTTNTISTGTIIEGQDAIITKEALDVAQEVTTLGATGSDTILAEAAYEVAEEAIEEVAYGAISDVSYTFSNFLQDYAWIIIFGATLLIIMVIIIRDIRRKRK
jgi:DNA-binding transcriptional ArsR family regulator